VDNKSPDGVGGSLGAPEWKEGIIFELSCVVGKKLEEALGASLNGGGVRRCHERRGGVMHADRGVLDLVTAVGVGGGQWICSSRCMVWAKEKRLPVG
jgi:hypothetical protein